MRESFLPLLRCPACRAELTLSERTGVHNDGAEDVREGKLACTACESAYPIQDGIPVFVPEDGYVDNFGWQWTRFAHIQRDSYNGSTIVRDTILRRSGWTPEWLSDKRLLECGCGSGNDTEVLLDLCKEVVSFDLSRGVHARSAVVRTAKNGMQMQADIRKIPVDEGAFDVVYCHRVIQHTPEPELAFASMARHLKPGGTFFLHSYGTHWKSLANYKYLWRPLTTRLPHRFVYRALRIVGPLLYPVAAVFDHIGPIRRIGKLIVPFEYHGRGLRKGAAKLSLRERYEYAFLITFDALTPTFDQPNPPEVLVRWFEENGFEDVVVRQERPVIVVGRKRAAQTSGSPGSPGSIGAPIGSAASSEKSASQSSATTVGE